MATATKKKTNKKVPVATVIFSTFDSSGSRELYRNIRNQKLSEWEPIGLNDYAPCGGTPLIDATARFIGHLSSLKKKGTVVIGCLADESGSMIENIRSVIDGVNEFVGGMINIDIDPDTDGKVLAVILTDGLENSSRETTSQDLQTMIQEKEKEDWTFIYLGANQDAWSTAQSHGFSGGLRGQAFDYTSSPVGTTNALRTVGTMAGSYLSNNAVYDSMATEESMGTISEKGGTDTWSTKSENESNYNIDDAIKKAKGEK